MRVFAFGLTILFCAGCVSTRVAPVHAPSLPSPVAPGPVVQVQASFGQPSESVGPATLDELVETAVRVHPDLQAARALVQANYGRMIQAGLYPNPQLGPYFTELGDPANKTGEAGARLIFTVMFAHKLKLAKAAGALAVEAADWQALTRSIDIVTRVRTAYFELLTALREERTTVDLLRTSDDALEAARKLEKIDAGNRPDVLRAQIELEQVRLKKDVAHQRVIAARQNLVIAMGRPEIVLAGIEKNVRDLEQPAPAYEWEAMIARIKESSELNEARSLAARAEKLVAKAHADSVPDLTVTGIPFYESSDRTMRGEIFATAPIPIFDRNQGNIHAAKADLIKARADERSIELKLMERLTAAYQRLQSARKQADAYNNTIVPGARESLRLIEAGYRRGDKKYDYTAVLQAQRTLYQAELAQTTALGDLWRSIVEVAGILQQDTFAAGCTLAQADQRP